MSYSRLLKRLGTVLDAELIAAHSEPALLSGHLINFSDTDELAAVKKEAPASDVFPCFLDAYDTGYFFP